ncbi:MULTISPECIES: hypothetical protein [unclassified Nocardia]|uniref:hypothetical protein n=1 Tax=unclassified Nocardia TaxID=2637762 RepID=UPI00278C2048|nr:MULTISPECIES: hypothetical protein [unclassified Nocardia]
MNILKSIGAIVAGFAVAATASSATDLVLESSGYLPSGHLYAPVPVVLSVILYRTGFAVLGAYVAAGLAPAHPMRHALVLGALGTVGGFGAAIATWNMNIGPHWYALAVAATGLPAAYLGGLLRTRRLTHRTRVAVAAG